MQYNADLNKQKLTASKQCTWRAAFCKIPLPLQFQSSEGNAGRFSSLFYGYTPFGIVSNRGK